jgi:hypothetical protein
MGYSLQRALAPSVAEIELQAKPAAIETTAIDAADALDAVDFARAFVNAHRIEPVAIDSAHLDPLAVQLARDFDATEAVGRNATADFAIGEAAKLEIVLIALTEGL